MTEVIVVGGGASGLATAALLAHSGFEVAVVESQKLPPQAPGPEPELRVVALSPASERILCVCGAWAHLDQSRVQPWSQMRVWERSASTGVEFRTSDINKAHLGHIVENSNLVRALYKAAEAVGVTWLTPDEVTELNICEHSLELSLSSGAQTSAEIVIAADGALSSLRDMAYLRWDYEAHQQQAIIAEIATDNDLPETAWQRFTPQGTVALLPLFNGHYSLVWSTVNAQELMCGEKESFEKALNQILGGKLGGLRLQSPKVCLDLGRGFAPQWCSERLALLGDAAHVVHPLAGLGQNLGFMDAAVLQEELVRHPLSARALRAYERRRKGYVWATQQVLEGFYTGFSLDFPYVARVRSAALSMVGRSRLLRRFFIQQADGRIDGPKWLRRSVELESRQAESAS